MADGRWQKKERTSGKKGAIEADLVLYRIALTRLVNLLDGETREHQQR
jgi:hypothetical protein